MLPRSPRITALSWGSITVEGHGEFKDARLWPGGAEEWDWNVAGTRHSPGTQPADIEDLLDAGATVVVLSRGMQERLGVAAATLDLLETRGVAFHVAETTAAVKLYNSLIPAAAVAGVFHSTC